MAVIETKYAIGDVVYRAGMTTAKRRHSCPDCNDTKKWKAVSPAGAEMDFPCPRCQARNMRERDLSLEYHVYEASVDRLTIGSIRLDTNDDRPVEYMCRETGVGSGSIYKESDLFLTEEAALQAAQARAEAATKEQPWMVERFTKSLDISDFQLSDAKTKLASDALIDTSVKISMLLDDLRDCRTIEEIQQRLERGFGD